MVRGRPRRITVIALMSVAAVVAGWLVAAIIVIGNPTLTDPPGSADAIVVLGPSNKRVAAATDLAGELGVENLALSIGDFPGQVDTCEQPGVTVVCFVPDPYTTAGEAARIGQLAVQHGWESIVLVAAKPQAARAAWLVGRCFDGQVQVVAATNAESIPSAWDWPWALMYQSGAWVKDWLTASCAPPLPPGVAPA